MEEAAWNGEQGPLQQEPREGGPLAPVEGLRGGTKAPLCKKVVQRPLEIGSVGMGLKTSRFACCRAIPFLSMRVP